MFLAIAYIIVGVVVFYLIAEYKSTKEPKSAMDSFKEIGEKRKGGKDMSVAGILMLAIVAVTFVGLRWKGILDNLIMGLLVVIVVVAGGILIIKKGGRFWSAMGTIVISLAVLSLIGMHRELDLEYIFAQYGACIIFIEVLVFGFVLIWRELREKKRAK